MSKKEVKEIIKCIVLKMHRHMEVLFNYAEITDTLVENNPREVSPTEFKERTGAKE